MKLILLEQMWVVICVKELLFNWCSEDMPVVEIFMCVMEVLLTQERVERSTTIYLWQRY